MQGTETKLVDQEPGKSQPELIISSLKSKRGKKTPKSKSRAKPIDPTVKKRRVSESLIKRARNDSANRKKRAGGKIVLGKNDPKSAKKLFLSLQSSKGNGENDDGEEVDLNKVKKRREKKKKRKREKVDLDEASRLKRRTRYLLIKVKMEQNLIDAYSTEGWKGQSREKIKPDKELERAHKQILNCKLGIRDAICQLDLLSKVGSIEDSVIGPDGSVYHEHIFCAKCNLREAFLDNDIILCDGTCNRAFHQKCLDPPLDTENIPPEDQGWFCKYCECKMEILELTNAHIGTCFSLDSSWEDVFKEEAACPDGGNELYNEEEWPSDESGDDDYKPENGEEGNNEENISYNSSTSSTSLSWSLDGESCTNGDSTASTEADVISGRRQRQAVDYKKLYHEMFGKDVPAFEQVSEDEDWGPGKRKRREKESDAASTLITLYESEKKSAVFQPGEKAELYTDPQNRRSVFRLPCNAVEKLREVFANNELPSREVKYNLSKELGLDTEKVGKWFKNARYLALKSRKAEGTKQHHSSPRTNEIRSEDDAMKNSGDQTESKEIAAFTPTECKNVNRKKQSKATTVSTLQKNQFKGCSDKDITEVEDDVSLKGLVKARTMEKKRRGFKDTSRFEEAEEMMERLCTVKCRLENMQQSLARFYANKKANKRKKKRKKSSDKSHLFDIMYVPRAVLKEKV